MGYSISMEQAEKLDRNRRDGRLCAMSTGRGGCFNRATRRITDVAVNVTHDGQTFDTGHAEGTLHQHVMCKRHADEAQRTADYYDGEDVRGYRLVSIEVF